MMFCRLAFDSWSKLRGEKAWNVGFELIKKHPNNIGLRVELLLAMLERESEDSLTILRLVNSIIYLCARTGSAIPFEDLMLDFLRSQLTNRQMRASECLQYLFAYRNLLLHRMLRSPAVETSVLFQLESVDMQIAVLECNRD